MNCWKFQVLTSECIQDYVQWVTLLAYKHLYNRKRTCLEYSRVFDCTSRYM